MLSTVLSLAYSTPSVVQHSASGIATRMYWRRRRTEAWQAGEGPVGRIRLEISTSWKLTHVVVKPAHVQMNLASRACRKRDACTPEVKWVAAIPAIVTRSVERTIDSGMRTGQRDNPGDDELPRRVIRSCFDVLKRL